MLLVWEKSKKLLLSEVCSMSIVVCSKYIYFDMHPSVLIVVSSFFHLSRGILKKGSIIFLVF